ncbi:MAG: hypothetical protein KF703_15635 [Actinobacteria bacterium]|nr:hypothetical protein [Actinomycetota bacterium]
MRDDGSSESAGTFSLTPREQAATGITWRNGRLRLRPSLGARFASAFQVGFGLCFVAGSLATGRWILAPVAVPQVVIGILHLRCRVDATGGGIEVVDKWRRVHVDLDDVADVVVRPFEPDSGFLPCVWPLQIWRRDLEAGLVQRRSGSPVRCDALVAFAQPGDAVLPAPVRPKVHALQRWLAAERSS